MLWFTSDLHLRHENIVRYSNRPFADAGEMGRAIIDNINARVGPDDTLWILGDVCMGQEKLRGYADLLSRLVCQDVRLVRGNHDVKQLELYEGVGFAEVTDLTEISLGGKRQRAVLCHYPMLSWNRSGRGSVMLHGHIHSEGREYNLQNRSDGIRRYDVGVDANDFAPVSSDEIRRFFGIAS